MYLQHDYVRDSVALTAGEVYRLDLPENGLLSAITMWFSGGEISGYGNTGGKWRMLDELTKFAVMLNASTPAISLTGKQAQAFYVWDQKRMPASVWRNYATNTQFAHFLLNFGGFFGDPTLALDLARYDNVQLQLTNTFDGSTDFSEMSVKIMLHYLRDHPTANVRGYLRKEEWKSWTTVRNTVEYSSLPVDYRLRRIMLQGYPDEETDYRVKTPWRNLMYNVKLALDTGNTVVFDAPSWELMRINALQIQRDLVMPMFPYVQADYGFDVGFGHVQGYAMGAGAQDGSGASTVPTFESARSDNTMYPQAYEGDKPVNMLVTGFSPFNSALFSFDHDPDPMTWLDPRARATVKLDVTTRDAASAAGGTNYIVLDRFVPH